MVFGLSGMAVGGMSSGPSAAFEVRPGRPAARSEARFAATGTTGSSWQWMFGDGYTSTEKNPSHVYENPGTYAVTLRVSDGGMSSQTTSMLDVSADDTLTLLTGTGHPFTVTLEVKNPDPTNGLPATEQAQAIPQNDVFGYFTFPILVPQPAGAPLVPEVFVKMLDARPIPGQDFWVFWGGLTTLDYTLTVTDTVRGTVKTYNNPVTADPGCLSADTSGFANAPAASPTPTPTPGSSATRVVNIGEGGNQFVDATTGGHQTTIHVGDSVQWNWVANTHTTTAGSCKGSGGAYGGEMCTGSGEWDSGMQSAGHQFTQVFTKAGTYGYFCGVHGSAMTATVVVTE